MKTVKISSNEIGCVQVGIYPVKVKQYKKFKECKGKKNEPVVNVNWFDAIAYCNWLSEKHNLPKYYTDEGEIINEKAEGWRLPTRLEWEYLAKAGSEYKYAGSDDVDEVAWYEGNSEEHIHVCGLKKPNDFGLYDMSGNVWEWCFDIRYDSNRVDCGGGWNSNVYNCEVSSWGYGDTDYRGDDLGFRVLRNTI